MSMVGFPLLLIPLAIYNIIVFLMPGVSLTETLVSLPLTSGATWQVSLSDVLVTLGILMLLLEVIKGARPGAKYLTDHLLSLIVLGAAVAEFLLLPRFANSTYFLLALLALTEFFSGVALRVRRPPGVAATSRKGRREAAEVSQEPVAPQPATAAPASQTISPVPSEPTFEHPPATVDHPVEAAAPPAPEAVAAEAKPGSGESH